MCLVTSASDVATLALLDGETCHSYWDYVLFPRPPVQIGFLLQGFQMCPISLVNAPFLFRVFPTFPSNGFYVLPIIFVLVICMVILFLVLHHLKIFLPVIVNKFTVVELRTPQPQEGWNHWSVCWSYSIKGNRTQQLNFSFHIWDAIFFIVTVAVTLLAKDLLVVSPEFQQRLMGWFGFTKGETPPRRLVF